MILEKIKLLGGMFLHTILFITKIIYIPLKLIVELIYNFIKFSLILLRFNIPKMFNFLWNIIAKVSYAFLLFFSFSSVVFAKGIVSLVLILHFIILTIFKLFFHFLKILEYFFKQLFYAFRIIFSNSLLCGRAIGKYIYLSIVFLIYIVVKILQAGLLILYLLFKAIVIFLISIKNISKQGGQETFYGLIIGFKFIKEFMSYKYIDFIDWYKNAFSKIENVSNNINNIHYKKYRRKIIKIKTVQLSTFIKIRIFKLVEYFFDSKFWKFIERIINNIINIFVYIIIAVKNIYILLINAVLFLKNVTVILIFIFKSVVGAIGQFIKALSTIKFNRKTLQVCKSFFVFIFSNFFVFIKQEIILTRVLIMKLIRSIFIFIFKDVFIAFYQWLKYNVINFIGLLFLLCILILGTFFYFNNKDKLLEQQTFWLNKVGIMQASKLLTYVIENDIFQPVRYYKTKVTIEPGQNIYSVLLNQNIESVYATKVVSALSSHYNLKNIKPGWAVHVIIASSNIWGNYRLQKLSISIDSRYDLIAEADENYDYTVYRQEKKFTKYTARRKISVVNSIYQSAEKAGVPNSIVAEFFKVLSWDVDFQREIQEKDTMEVVYECLVDENNEVTKCDNLLYGSLKGKKKDTFFYKYNGSYYHENGKSASKTLIKTPTKSTRVSSPFGVRIHPVLGFTSFHKGIDFAAPTGTEIYASGQGIVVKKYTSTTYGNYIKIRHNPYLETAYAHMNNFARGIKVGDRVAQGQLIGYVGATGRVTGPHLHYEILINGKQVNPNVVKTPSNKELEGEELIEFNNYRESFDSFLVRLPQKGSILSPKW